MLPKMGGGSSNGVGSFACCVILLLCAVNNVNSYSKYGRGCQDIGCLPSEECIITQDSCSYAQREGKDCGNYPTCKKKYGASSSSAPVPVNPSGTSFKTGFESNIFSIPSAPSSSSSSSSSSASSSGSSSSSSNSNGQNYYNSNGNNGGGTADSTSYNGDNGHNNNNNNYNNNNNNNNPNGDQNSNKNNNHNNNNNNNGKNNGNNNVGASNIDPHYVFGAPHNIPFMPDIPIFPYNAPTSAPSFQQFPQPNHPGSVYNPGIFNPSHLQPVNPLKPSFVFGQQPYYSQPAGTGGPPNNNGGGGLAPYYGGNLPQPNMFNKPPPQYQNQNQYPNQNTYNRQTQSHHRYSDATRLGGLSSVSAVLVYSCLGYIFNTFLMQQWSFVAQRT